MKWEAARLKSIGLWGLAAVGLLVFAGVAIGVASMLWLPEGTTRVMIVSLVVLLGAGFVFGWLSKVDSALRATAAIVLYAALCLALAASGLAQTPNIPGMPPLPVALVIGMMAVGSLFVFSAAIGEQAAIATEKKIDAWEHCAAWIGKHGPLPLLGFLTIVVLVIHAGVFRGETAGDDLTFHFAESARISDCLRGLDFDCWNPSANAGYASAYYYQVLPQLASAAPAALLGHHLFWFQLSVVLPLVLAPAAAYRGMRILGATPWQALLAAFCVAFMNGESRWGSGNAGTFQVGLYTQTWALSVFPLALGHAVRWMTHGKSLAPAIAWGAFVFLCHPFAGVCLALALLIGWLANGVLLGFDHLFAAIARAWPDRPAWLAHWATPPERTFLPELVRGGVLAVAYFVTWLPVLAPLKIDADGFGGFPHRVNDEVGPGFAQLWTWYSRGFILDFANGVTRIAVLTWSLPVIAIFARGRFFRWLWGPALVFALLLGFGPHMGKLGDDIFPPVRALGAMQTVLAMGIGAGAIILGRRLWEARQGTPAGTVVRISLFGGVLAIAATLAAVAWIGSDTSIVLEWMRRLTLGRIQTPLVLRVIATLPLAIAASCALPLWRSLGTDYGARTGLAAAFAGMIMLVAAPGFAALGARVRVLGDMPGNNRGEMMEISKFLAAQPQGRKLTGPGAENHWWNLLSYVYDRVPSLLQMGGGGLQASPNYDFLWTQRDMAKSAWLYDAPYVEFMKSMGDKIPAGESLLQTEHYEIRKLSAPGLVSPVHVTGVLPPGYRTGEPGHKAALDWIKTDAPLKDEVLAYEGSGPVGEPPDGKTLKSWRQDSPGDNADIVAEVEAQKPTTYVIRESWHPRWHAYVDGAEVKVRRVTPDFPAVDVPPGKHTIELRFERPWWALAVWLLWPGLAVAGWLYTRRKQRPDALTSKLA